MNTIPIDERETIRGLISILEKAITDFEATDRDLLEIDVSEQCMCARLAYHLQRELENSEYSDYIVDCEYNRGMEKVDDSIKKHQGKNVRLDIAVHKRPYDQGNECYHNLMCIEMKKSDSSRKKRDKDRERLLEMTQICHGFQFALAAFIIADKNHLNIANLYSREAGYGFETELTT